MLRKIFLILLFFCGILLGQKRTSPIFIEHNSVKGISQIEYISYRIPFNQLLFVKNGNAYKASFTFIFEIYKDKEFVKREISKQVIFTNNYNDTKSNKVFFEDLIGIELEPNKYLLKPTLAIGGTELDVALPELKIEVSNLDKQIIYPPIVINNNTSNKEKQINFQLTNLQNHIPFSPKQHSILLGVKDTSINSIEVEITQNEKSIYKENISKYFLGSLQLSKDELITIKLLNEEESSSYFLVNDFSYLLEEGEFEIDVKADTAEIKFTSEVFWLNKPKLLSKPEYSIKLLSYIEDTDIVRSLLKGTDEKYYQNLFNYWSDHFPSKVKYNYALNEYYSRADYAVENFKSLKSQKGAESDRGKIYITYGKPTSTERTYNEKNEIIEVWSYSEISRTFIFKDITGTGKYILTTN
ncbi:MAG: GWxTD domain-containing protein [Melioribacteraceae bacterium]